MEEVATPLDGVAHSGDSRTTATRTDRNRPASAPLSAPPRDQVAYHRWWRQNIGRERFLAAVKRWRHKNPEKSRAHDAVRYALRMGRLVKGPCERAGRDCCSGRIEAHHDDYTKRLDVRWLCKRHHKAADRERIEREVSA